MTDKHQFNKKLLTWFDSHGRKNLPWQQDITPYRVWLSEVMLQQTQVETVIPYFNRFLENFPDVYALAAAPIDHVLHLWSGLGYYARARNLHAAAQMVVKKYDGEFPKELESLILLPGIGRSTAGAILSIAFQIATPILDGNVKRVLTRYHAIEGWAGLTPVANQLWDIATELTPKKRVADYTQAIMDLGATLCGRNPQCGTCPLNANCQALKADRVKDFPYSKPKKTIPVKQTQFIIVINEDNHLLLAKRPPVGIWGGLWSFPECDVTENPMQFFKKLFGVNIKAENTLETFRHTFSHYHLDITPQLARIENKHRQLKTSDEIIWYQPKQPQKIGLAAPVKKILNALMAEEIN